jgi:hypothetical protein
VLVAGDFNLIRGFNDCIARLQLREVVRSGARFNRTNKQVNPIHSVLDRVLVSHEWETFFPLLSLVAETSIGSDHTPLVFSTGSEVLPKVDRFFFENSWHALPGFLEMVRSKWGTWPLVQGRYFDAIDFWHNQIGNLRRHLKGWGANLRRDSRLEKDTILHQIQELDVIADGVGLNDEGWMRCYHLEETLVNIY